MYYQVLHELKLWLAQQHRLTQQAPEVKTHYTAVLDKITELERKHKDMPLSGFLD